MPTLQHLVQVERALVYPAAHHVGGKARALLVAEDADRQGVAGLDSGLVEGRDHLEPGEHAQVAVVAPAGCDRVDMRAGHDRRAVFQPRARARQVADPVDGDGKAQRLHPGDDQVAPGLVLVRERQAADPAALDGADPGERVEAPEQTV